MPLWQIFAPEGAYTADDKRELGNSITDIYSENGYIDLPRFYTTVVFHELKPESFIVGGEPRDKFVQVAIVHAARTADEIAEKMGVSVPELEKVWMGTAHDVLRPFTLDRGYEQELHIEVVARETWSIDGMPPPPPYSETEALWAKQNKSSPYLQTA